jgi:hypothetical protein
LDNDASIFFRLTATSAAGATAGTSRVDNLIVNGERIAAAVPLPPAVFVFAGVAGVAGLARRRLKELLS